MEEVRKDLSKLEVCIEMQPLDAGALLENQREMEKQEVPRRSLIRNRAYDFDVTQSNLDLHEIKAFPVGSSNSSCSEDSGLVFAIDHLNKFDDGDDLSSFDGSSSIEHSDFDAGSLKFFQSSILSLQEETFIHEINKLENRKNKVEESPPRTCDNFPPVDVIFGVARLSYIDVPQPQFAQVVKLNDSLDPSERNKLEENHCKTDEKIKESPKVSFKLSETQAATPKRVHPPNRSPGSGRNASSNSPYRPKNPSESSAIRSTPTSVAARECCRLCCLLIALVIEIALIFAIIYTVPTHNVTGALAMLGLSILIVGTFVCGLVLFKIGGANCLGGQLTVV